MSKSKQLRDVYDREFAEDLEGLTTVLRLVFGTIASIGLYVAAIVDPLLYRNVGKHIFRVHLFLLPILTLGAVLLIDPISVVFFATSTYFAYREHYRARARDKDGLQVLRMYHGDPWLAEYLSMDWKWIRLFINPLVVLGTAIVVGAVWLGYIAMAGVTYVTFLPYFLVFAAIAQFLRTLILMLTHYWGGRKHRQRMKEVAGRTSGMTEDEEEKMLLARMEARDTTSPEARPAGLSSGRRQ